MTSVFWFRRDARLDDHPALNAAVDEGTVVPLFILDPHLLRRCSHLRHDLLLAGLAELDADLQRHGGRLRVESGDPRQVIPRLLAETGARRVHVSSEVTPYARRRDSLVADQVDLVGHDGIYALPPGALTTAGGEPYKVFSPFFRCWSQRRSPPVSLPEHARFTDSPGQGLDTFGNPIVAAGSQASRTRLESFVTEVDDYADQRDRIDLDATSGLSVDLKFGWIGVRRLIHEIGTGTPGRDAFTRQVAWRDFYAHLMARWPSMVDRAMRDRHERIPWRNDPAEIESWKSGKTGFPIVDAAMRRLVTEGQMHNRARMIAASFLVKDLLVDWRIGERFFRHHLIDADVPQNSGNWQWVAGTGTDAAPYFRVFNPITQSIKYDPDALFIKKWLPELDPLDVGSAHRPWDVGPLQRAATTLASYPDPIVDHAMARRRAIDAYERSD